LEDFCCGANQIEKHLTNCNWHIDAKWTELADLRNVVEGDISPDGKGHLSSARGIEVGHIFQLGTKYSQAMNASVLNDQGKAVPIEMGCYGLGISRVVAAAIEQHHDENGIIWPKPLAPFDITLLPMNMHKSEKVKAFTEELYQKLTAQGFDVLLDDRNERAGVMFADSDLIGIPHRIVIGEKSLNNEMVEYKSRKTNEKKDIPLSELDSFISEL
jgi:prolyl-tRNA synthetase